jgi:hypothetical protein
VDAKGVLKAVDKRIKDVRLDPVTNAADFIPNALKQPRYGEAAVIIGGIMPPSYNTAPCVLNEAP